MGIKQDRDKIRLKRGGVASVAAAVGATFPAPHADTLTRPAPLSCEELFICLGVGRKITPLAERLGLFTAQYLHCGHVENPRSESSYRTSACLHLLHAYGDWTHNGSRGFDSPHNHPTGQRTKRRHWRLRTRMKAQRMLTATSEELGRLLPPLNASADLWSSQRGNILIAPLTLAEVRCDQLTVQRSGLASFGLE